MCLHEGFDSIVKTSFNHTGVEWAIVYNSTRFWSNRLCQIESRCNCFVLTANIFESGPMPTPIIEVGYRLDTYTKPNLVPLKGI